MNKIEQMREATEKCLKRADELYGTRLAGNVAIRFDIGGHRSAGQAGFRGGNFFLRFHPNYIEHHFDEMLNDVVPHEVAHVVGYAAPEQGARRHNPNWKRICIELGGTGERCHSMDNAAFAAPKRNTKPYVYADEHGREWHMSAQVHNKMQKGWIRKTKYGIQRFFPGEVSYTVKRDGLKGKIDKDSFVRKEGSRPQALKKAAPKKRKAPRKAAKGQLTKAQIVRNLIKLHFPMGPDHLNEKQLIAKIANTCGFNKSLAKTYYNNNLTKAMQEK